MKKVSLWQDKWLPISAASVLINPDNVLPLLKAKAKDLIHENSWHFPSALSESFPDLVSLIRKIHIPIVSTEDSLVWKHTNSGTLSLKDAYNFSAYNPLQLYLVNWGKLIWNSRVPLIRSFLYWRLLHGKVSY